MKTLIEKGEGIPLKCTFVDGVKLKHVGGEGDKPSVSVVYEGEKSNGDFITLCLCLYRGDKDGDFETFEGTNTVPLRGVLKRCLFDVESFMDGSKDETHSAFSDALDYALNALGSICFCMEDGQPMARFEFSSHYVLFSFEEEDATTYFSFKKE